MIYWDGTEWKSTKLYKDPVGLARVAVGDCDLDNPGKEIVVGSDSGAVAIIRGSGNSWNTEVIFTDTDKNRGVWVGDANPNHPGNEIVAYGYSNNVTLIFGSSKTWEVKTIWEDADKGHEVRIGEFDPTHKGNEILVVGYSNNATMVAYNYADFEISSGDKTKIITSGGEIKYEINLTAIEGFDRDVTLTLISGIPSIANYNFDPNTVILSSGVADGTSILTLNIEPTTLIAQYNLTIIATGGGKTHSIILKLDIQGDTTSPSVQQINIQPDSNDIDIHKKIVINFDEPMNTTSVESEFSISPTVNGTFSWTELEKLEFTPNSDLKYDKTYSIEVGENSKDLAGNLLLLNDNSTFKFKTEIAPGEECNTILLPILTIVIIVILVFLGQSAKKDKSQEEKLKEEEATKKSKEKELEVAPQPEEPPTPSAAPPTLPAPAPAPEPLPTIVAPAPETPPREQLTVTEVVAPQVVQPESPVPQPVQPPLGQPPKRIKLKKRPKTRRPKLKQPTLKESPPVPKVVQDPPEEDC